MTRKTKTSGSKFWWYVFGIIIIVNIVIVFVGLSGQSGETERDRLARLGVDAQRRGDWGAAIDFYTQAIELGPDARLYYNRGVTYLNAELLTEALNDIEQAIALEPTYAPPYRVLGDIRLQSGDQTGAAEAFSNYLDLADPQDPDYAIVETQLATLRAEQ